ncbi:hypothetical protein PR202_ga09008 [Eleusine coracana subsp. coracana]|uniref:Uncharacterized protein n=1 Tax=Eleusine coracana subsp. coracana TaxID=191504 RepID=A0AAV5C2P3_ELECO|nr:hypothetical protein QOZ80_1AG0040240 [Eleusine coracana subsp. coracana]GJM92531.1 hypothetical protein PR202_ga09008 [Eleusine coracana subsp. coracana]
MLTLHTVRTSLPLTHRSSPCRRALLVRTKRSFICASSSEDAESGEELPLGGDKRQQEVLAQIAMLQAQKVRITNFLDERSAYLTKLAKDADTEFDMIGQNAMKELDAVGDQIMERLESKMQAFEETAEVQRQEIEMNDKVLEDFEDWIEKEKNEGMFFKSLGKVKPKNKKEIKVKAKVEAEKVKEIAKETAGSKARMNIYLGLMAILGLTIANAVFATPDVEWRKVAALGLIFIGLVAQVIYEQDFSPPKAENTGKKEE